MTIEYIINTPKYSPPQDLFKLDKHLTTWNKSLAPYKKDPQENSCRYQTNWALKKWVYTTIWEYNSITHNLDKTSVVIYDRFPKSAIHLLLLPLTKNYQIRYLNLNKITLNKLLIVTVHVDN